MKAIVFHGHEDMRVDDVPDPSIEADTDILLEIETTAICGSDLHLWHMEDGSGMEPGFTVGHEFLGKVADTGKAVQNVKKGDRVLVSCTIGCGHCPSCKRGVFSGCTVTTNGLTKTNVFGFGSYGGGQAEAARVPFADTNCFKIPSSLSADDCLFLTDILPTGFMGTEFAEVGPGDTVVVFGCGPVGTFAQMCAQVRGASQVIAVDLDQGRLKRAAARGCRIINPTETDVVSQVLEWTNGVGADSAIEAVGVPELITQAAMVTRPGGNVSVIGVIMGPYEIQWPLFFSKNLSLRTGLVNPQIFIPKLLPLIEREILDPAVIISHRFSLDEGREGYVVFANHRDDVLKVVLDV